MNIRHFFIGLFIIGIGILIWGYYPSLQNKPTPTTPTTGIQNSDPLIMSPILKTANLTTYDNSKDTPRGAKSVIEALLMLTNSDGQKAYLKAYLAQLRSMERMNVIKCGELIENPEKYPPNEIAKLISPSAQKTTLDALKTVINSRGSLYTSKSYHMVYEEPPKPVRIEDQKIHLCRTTIGHIEAILRLDSELKKSSATADFIDSSKFKIFVF